MTFNSLQFVVFFPVVTALYFLLPHRFRWALLLAASALFYMAFIPKYIFVLLALIVVDYSAGILIERSAPEKRKWFLILSILSTCVILFIFKYFEFFSVNLTALAQFLGWNYSFGFLKLILPLGLSFHVFQSLSYVIEVYRGKQKSERNFGIYALYVMFFPQLVSGPIERPYNLLHQFYEKHTFDYERVASGLRLMLWGMFKKVVIADRLALFVNQVYGDPMSFEGISFLMATFFFAFQIYCDFSGYTDIAIGAARVLGFNLMKNFNLPYFSKSIPEFWTRWHISLSSWFKDYLFVPLYMSFPFGKRLKVSKAFLSIIIVFLISGLWHGANWTFVAWGGLHGLFYAVYLASAVFWRKLPGFFQMAATFSMVSFTLIFFRAQSMQDAFYIVSHLFSNVGNFIAMGLESIMRFQFGQGIFSPILVGQTLQNFVLAMLALGVLFAVEIVQFRGKGHFELKPLWMRWSAYYALILAILFFGVFDKVQQFIYFQF